MRVQLLSEVVKHIRVWRHDRTLPTWELWTWEKRVKNHRYPNMRGHIKQHGSSNSEATYIRESFSHSVARWNIWTKVVQKIIHNILKVTIRRHSINMTVSYQVTIKLTARTLSSKISSYFQVSHQVIFKLALKFISS